MKSVLLAVLAVFSLSACQPAEANEELPKDDTPVVVVTEGEVATVANPDDAPSMEVIEEAIDQEKKTFAQKVDNWVKLKIARLKEFAEEAKEWASDSSTSKDEVTSEVIESPPKQEPDPQK